jgi:predicted amidohydrolase YtcJ
VRFSVPRFLLKNLFTQADLESDPVTRGRRIILHSKDAHAVWVSSKVIEMSSPLPETVDGGTIFRDASGNPTGMTHSEYSHEKLLRFFFLAGVFMDNAQDVIDQPLPSDELLAKRFALTVQDALSIGLTSVHDAGLDPTSLAFFKRYASSGIAAES